MAGTKPSGAQTLRAVERLVIDQLPPGWSLRVRREPRRRVRQANAEWSVRSPDGSEATFVVEAKRDLLGRQINDALAQLAAFEGRRPLIAAPYLGSNVRSSLRDRGVSYTDTTGNLRIVSDRPGLFIDCQGATKDPWPSDEALQSLRGRGAGRAVRALVDFRPPYGVRDLANRGGVPSAPSPGRSTSSTERDS